MTKTTQSLTAQLKDVAQAFCAEVWSKALNIAKVIAYYDFRGVDKVYYPLAPSIASPSPNPSPVSSMPQSTITLATKLASGKDKK